MGRILSVFKKDGSKVADGTAAQVEIKGLAANTKVAAGDYKAAWVEGSEVSEFTDVPGFTVKPVLVTGVKIDNPTISLDINGTETIKASVVPATATNKKLSFLSADPKIATVTAAGLVTGVAAGTVDIAVTSEEGAKTSKCKVTVTEVSEA